MSRHAAQRISASRHIGEACGEAASAADGGGEGRAEGRPRKVRARGGKAEEEEGKMEMETRSASELPHCENEKRR